MAVSLISCAQLLLDLDEKVEAALTQKPVTISSLVYTDQHFDPAVDQFIQPGSTGYVVIQGGGFSPVCDLSLVAPSGKSTLPNTVTYFSETKMGLQIPYTLESGVYSIRIYRPDVTEFTFSNVLVVSSMPVWTTPESLPGAIRGVPYSTTLAASDGESSPMRYEAITQLPTGLVLDAATGTLSGTITEFYSRMYRFTIRAVDAQNQSAERDFMMIYTDPAPIWTTGTTIGPALYNQAFSLQLSASEAGGSSIAYSALSALPPNTSLSPTGVLSGLVTQDVSTSFSFTARAMDEQNQVADRAFVLEYLGKPPSITTGASANFSIGFTNRGIATWGWNNFGQLGTDNVSASNANPTPMNISNRGSLSGKTIATVSLNYNHTLAVATDGSIHAWGRNTDGQLGTSVNFGTYNANPTPMNISSQGSLSGKAITTVSTGSGHAVAVATDGSIHAWGLNSHGQMAITGGPVTTPTPVNISSRGSLSGKTITTVSCGDRHTVAIASDGSIHAWGVNQYGELGTTTNNGSTSPNPTPVNISSQGSLSGKTIIAVSCGGRHTMAVASDGSIHAWGRNNYGQLGTNINFRRPNPTPMDISGQGSLSGKTITAVSASSFHTMAVASDGSIHAWGGNGGPTVWSATPFDISTQGSLSGKTITAVSCGLSHTLAVATDGSIHAWGVNQYGQLATATNNGTTTPNHTPVDITQTFQTAL